MSEKKLHDRKAERSKAWMDAALSLSNQGSAAKSEAEWSDLETQTCLALVSAALRLKNKSLLEQALATFGGLPPVSPTKDFGEQDPLGLAARSQDAFGFERVLELRQMEAMDSKETSLGEWLRAGLINSPWGSSRLKTISEARSASRGRPMPLACALDHDNPVALAVILGSAERLAALEAMEPKDARLSEMRELDTLDPKAGDYTLRDWRSKKAKAYATIGASLETALIYQALSANAFKCVALLAQIPEFGSKALCPRALGLALGDGYSNRSAQRLFQESEPVAFSFFEWAVVSINATSGSWRPDYEKSVNEWRSMIEAMIEHAPPEAKSETQEGTGMGWPEIYWARQDDVVRNKNIEANDYTASKITSAMSMLEWFDARGFDVDWDIMASTCDKGSVLGDWLSVRGASSKAMDAKPGVKSKKKSL